MKNVSTKSKLKTLTKNVYKSLEDKDFEKSKENFRILSQHLDKAAQKGIIHKKTADRKKSRIAKKINLTFADKA
jgi:small subunit ribosomal protein S20